MLTVAALVWHAGGRIKHWHFATRMKGRLGHSLALGLVWVILHCANEVQGQSRTTITVTSPDGPALLLDQPYPLSATASSGLPVSFHVRSGPALISGGTIKATNTGRIVLVAEQAGDGTYSPASVTNEYNQLTVMFERLSRWPAPAGAGALGIQLAGDRAYAAMGAGGMEILDISNPAKPARLGTYTGARNPQCVRVRGTRAYLADDAGLQIIDVRDPRNPVRLGGFDFSGAPPLLEVNETVAVLSRWGSGSKIIDVRDPARPALLAPQFFVHSYVSGMQLVGSLLYQATAGSGTLIIDLADPARPRVRGACSNGLADWPLGVRVNGSTACVARAAGIETYDVSNPDHPVFLAANGRLTIDDVRFIGPLAYLLGSSHLMVCDLTNPADPSPVGIVYAGGTNPGWEITNSLIRATLELDFVGATVCVAEYEAGLGFYKAASGVDPRLYLSLPLTLVATNPPVPIHAQSFSGLPVTRTLVSGPATISGDHLILAGGGKVIVRAETPGNEQFLPARVEATIEVRKLPQSLAWSSPANGTALPIGKSVRLEATASSGRPVSYRVKSGGAVIANGALTVIAPGNVVIVAEQSGDAFIEPVQETRFLNLQDVRLEKIGGLTGIPVGKGVNALKAEGKLLYVAGGAEGVSILNIGNPSQITRLGAMDTSGTAESVYPAGTLAYVADGDAGLQILDTSDPARPARLGGFDTPGYARDVTVSGTVAYVADDEGGLQIIDVSDPRAPTRVASYDRNYVTRVKVESTRAFLGWFAGFDIIDVSDPANPRVLEQYRAPFSSVRDFWIEGWWTYLAGPSYPLHAVNLYELNRVERVDVSASAGGYPYAVKGDGRFVYLLGADGLRVVDVGDPRAGRLAGQRNQVYSSLDLAGSLIYAAGANGIDVLQPEARIRQTIRFETPSPIIHTNSPQVLTATALSELPVAFSLVSGPATVSGNQLRLTGAGTVMVRAAQAGNEQFYPVAVTNRIEALRAPQVIVWNSPASNTVLRAGQAYPLEAVASGGLPVSIRVVQGPAMIANGLITVTNSGSVVLEAEQAGDAAYTPIKATRVLNRTGLAVTKLGNWPGLGQGEAKAVQVTGDLACVAMGSAGLAVLDVSNPAAPRLLGKLDTSGTANALHVTGNLVYVADGNAGLQIIDISNPAAPVRLGGLDTKGDANDVRVSGTLAYVADGNAGLQIIDVRDPANPVLKGQWSSGVYGASAVEVAGPLVYLGGDSPALLVIDASDAGKPARVGVIYGSIGGMHGMELAGNLAFTVGGIGQEIHDIHDPAKLTRIGGTTLLLPLWDLKVRETLILAGAGRGKSAGSLYVLDWAGLSSPALIATVKTDDSAYGIDVSGDRAYAAVASAGLDVFQLQPKLLQTISFKLPSPLGLIRSPHTLKAAASSGLPVTFSVVSGPGVVDGNQLILTNIGNLRIRAGQAGNEDFLPASVELSVNSVGQSAPPPSLSIILTSPGWARVTASAKAGLVCQVEQTHDLAAGEWRWIWTFASDGSPSSMTLNLASPPTSAYYRVVVAAGE